jgi:uncharacterized membrane protein YeaQ/YmgE (transglycosylase-associated protein family)
MNILVWIIFGAIVGWLADLVMKSDHGVLENVILGVIGAAVGGFLMNVLGASGVTGFNLYSIVVSVIGAAILIYIGRMVRR